MGLPGGIPAEKVPQCWSEDVRMNALFAPFRLKAANPDSWDMKMKFWSDMVRLWCRSKGDPVVSAADAKVAFQRNGRTPACIDIVIEEMFRNGDLVPLSKYQQILYNGPEGWVRWGARLAFKPAAIALTAVSALLPARHALDNDGLPKASIDSTQKFVLESVLKEQATALISDYPLGMNRVGTFDEIMSRCEWHAGRDAFEMTLGYLVDTGRALIQDNVIKLAEPGHKVTQITECDEALVKLSSAETRLEGDATRLSRDLAAAETDARASLALGNRIAAKNHLRRKHKAALRLDRCTAALENVKHLLQQMRDVSQNQTIVDTYKTAALAMKRGMKDNNMDEVTVHDTMDDLKEVMDSYGEIEKALSVPVEDDAAELEAELRELLLKPDDSVKAADATPTKPVRKVSEREFVFDGEERILAELNELGEEEPSPRREEPAVKPAAKPAKAAATEQWTDVSDKRSAKESPEPSKAWYPPSSEWNNNFAEIRQDDRIHPGQPLTIDYSSPPRLYEHEFQVRDHKMDDGVWLFNKDSNSNVDDLVGTEYCSSESPGKTGSNFQMAPGGERKKEPPVNRNKLPANRNEPPTGRNEPSAIRNELPTGRNELPTGRTEPPTSRNEPSAIRNEPSAIRNEPSASRNELPTGRNEPPATRKQVPDDFDDLERRLKNLRGFL